MDADLYELSDTLFAWRREFLRYENQGCSSLRLMFVLLPPLFMAAPRSQ
ncbi:hypothetical protein HGG75_10200 [Ochrobactrum pseudogrignonense]|nr:hypothetical protein [Brucella pseudogrignonensis]